MEGTLPEGICIPNGYTIDKVIKGFDFNRDAKKDIAVRYSIYPLVDGTMRYYSIYEAVDDTTYVQKGDLSNLVTPYINAFTQSYLKSHPIADSLANLYPTNIEFSFINDTILISHYLPDYYGKTYAFLFNAFKDSWYLNEVRYWIGNLPTWLVRNGNLKEELYSKIYLEKDKIVSKDIQINNFSFIESKKESVEESEYLMNKYDVFNWSKE